MPTYRTWWAWRRDSVVQHVAINGKKEGQLSTYCNRYWIRDHVLPMWEMQSDEPNDDRRPCLLCVGWLARNGAAWTPVLDWMRAESKRNRPNTPQARHLTAV